MQISLFWYAYNNYGVWFWLLSCLSHESVNNVFDALHGINIIHKHERRQFVFLNKTKCEKWGFNINKIELLFYIENNQKYKNTNIKTKKKTYKSELSTLAIYFSGAISMLNFDQNRVV